MEIKKITNDVKRLIDEAECMLIATDKGLIVEGKTIEIMTLLSGAIRELLNKKVLDEEMLEDVIKRAKMTDKDLLNETMELLKKLKSKKETKERAEKLAEAITDAILGD